MKPYDERLCPRPHRLTKLMRMMGSKYVICPTFISGYYQFYDNIQNQKLLAVGHPLPNGKIKLDWRWDKGFM